MEEVGAAAGHCLRFALNARPNGLAGLRSGSGPQQGSQLAQKKRKGDTSNEVRKGTFLKWVDTFVSDTVTNAGGMLKSGATSLLKFSPVV